MLYTSNVSSLVLLFYWISHVCLLGFVNANNIPLLLVLLRPLIDSVRLLHSVGSLGKSCRWCIFLIPLLPPPQLRKHARLALEQNRCGDLIALTHTILFSLPERNVLSLNLFDSLQCDVFVCVYNVSIVQSKGIYTPKSHNAIIHSLTTDTCEPEFQPKRTFRSVLFSSQDQHIRFLRRRYN